MLLGTTEDTSAGRMVLMFVVVVETSFPGSGVVLASKRDIEASIDVSVCKISSVSVLYRT